MQDDERALLGGQVAEAARQLVAVGDRALRARQCPSSMGRTAFPPAPPRRPALRASR